ncbi:hypothetical protein I79_026145 [Cricetulus griseus]|uniref:Uncharacterized protein n=1 Tax=Cricetulus griseus TaxID=10029 RepID=G3IQ54_CRIGR|nr:hypothetical protein I79_026145 [Cricetulus griseus]
MIHLTSGFLKLLPSAAGVKSRVLHMLDPTYPSISTSVTAYTPDYWRCYELNPDG